MNDVLRIARLKIALQRAFLGRAILIFTALNNNQSTNNYTPILFYLYLKFGFLVKLLDECYPQIHFPSWI